MDKIMYVLIHFILGGLNAYLATTNFMDGDIGLGMFGAFATLWCLAFAMYYLFKEEN
jgi:hypothetical protein